jgi:hypothetical protein
VTLWRQSVTALTLGEEPSLLSTALFEARLAVMKIVWRNPNPINRTSFSIVKTLPVEQADEMRVLYRSSKGAGALGTIYAVRMKETG